MSEPTETEVKFRVASPQVAREAVSRTGATLVRERHFEDNVLFDDSAGSLRAAGGVLRLRVTPHDSVFTFKGPRHMEGGIKTREERETRVQDPEVVHAILDRIGYRPIFRYQKYRETWAHRGQEIVIDETPIGTWVEIEGDPDGIRAVTADLGHRPSDYLADSYVDLFFSLGGEGDMTFDP